MSQSTSRVQAVMTCDGPTCSHHGGGHRVSAIQARVAAATPSKWRDAFVASLDESGWIGLDVLDALDGDAERVWVWHHAATNERLGVGQPVALHGVYDLLAIGRDRISVLVAASV